MAVIQPYISVSKLKKIKTKFVRCTGYLDSIKPYKARFIANSSSCTTTELSKLLTSCLKAVKNHVIKYCEKVYERSGKNLLSRYRDAKEPIGSKLLFLSPIGSRKVAYQLKTSLAIDSDIKR